MLRTSLKGSQGAISVVDSMLSNSMAVPLILVKAPTEEESGDWREQEEEASSEREPE